MANLGFGAKMASPSKGNVRDGCFRDRPAASSATRDQYKNPANGKDVGRGTEPVKK